MRRSIAIVALAILAVTSVAAAAAATTTGPRPKYFAVMDGSQEVPGPGDPDGFGVAPLRLKAKDGMVCFRILVDNIDLPATGAHIHEGDAGVAGPIVVVLTPPGADGRSRGCVAAAKSLIRDIRANPGHYYVNVHTSNFPAGAIRGQIVFQSPP
jgi:CHRD domain-containing protein